MKEFIILAVVTFFSLLTYWLVEPFAHSQMHAHVESEGFAYADLPALTKEGNATRGADTFMAGGCIGCHNVQALGMETGMSAKDAASAYGVNPPDLSNAGAIYDAKFLADLIKNPAHATIVEHKFNDMRMHPMPAFYGAGGDDIDQEIADIVAYMQSIAVQAEEVTPTMAFENACGRCHAVRYTNWTQLGEMPNFKYKKDDLRFQADVLDYQDAVKAYMGKLPPDLSMYIRSRNEHFISTFIENPQSQLHGTAMPRTGVTAHSAEKVIEYMRMAGDPLVEERNETGKNVMIYMIFFVLFAYLWKRQIWKDLH
ncbi:MAG: c-type cytochrome [Helicobacteraceae bacterium]|jgi:ubiquinol-cytochrome c reductase cytochrome c1 subunit|nr:c-type cytochrome [Helicobacteraceae bacterium]